jgi:uncharacterized protein YeeX (DUF496 family)
LRVKKFSFSEVLKFSTMFTRAFSGLFRARWIQSTSSYPVSLRSTLILVCHLLNAFFSWGLWLKFWSIHNKIILYKQVICPVWSYDIQLWGCTSDSNIQEIQRYQNEVLKCNVNAPWYIRNNDLYRDLEIETVTDIIAKFAKSHEKRLQDHINIEASRLLNVNNITRWLKLKKPFELVIR